MNKNLHIVLVGGNGFIGKALEKALFLSGYKNMTITSRRKLVQNDRNSFNISGVDITKPKTLESPIASADVVINLAGLISFAQKDREHLLSINGEGVLNVLRACKKNKNLYRFIHLSSTASFGIASHEIEESFRFDWSHSKRLVYSYSKFVANETIENSIVPTNIIYPCLVLGPGGSGNMKSIFKYVRNKKLIPIPPGGISVIDVRDLANAIVTVLEKAPPQENYIACGECISFENFFKHVCKILHQETKLLAIPAWSCIPLFFLSRFLEAIGFSKIRYEQVYSSFYRRRYSNKKLRGLGYIPKFSFVQTLTDSLSEKFDH